MTERVFADGTQITVVKHPSGTSDVLLLLDGLQVSRVVIIPMLIRIGAAVVRMDGIGGVDTVEGYRYRGYSRRVMETVVQQLTAGDAALSMLFGIQDYYQKFGYDTTGPEYTVILPHSTEGEATPSLPPGWLFRSLRVEDMPGLMSLYHRNTRRATGALVRHVAEDVATETEQLAGAGSDARRIGLRAWNRLRKLVVDPGEDACRVLLDVSGQMAAYAWYGANWWMGVRRRDLPEAFHLAEGFARDAESADALLSACRLWAHETSSSYEAVALASHRRVPWPQPPPTKAGRCARSTRAVVTSWVGCSTPAA